MSAPRPSIAAPVSPAADWLRDHGDALYRYALLRVRAPEAAEDLVQETLLAALTARQRFAGSSSEQTWLIGILKHKIIDHLRSLWRERMSEAEFGPDGGIDLFTKQGTWRRPVPAWRLDAAAELERREFHAALADCIRKLPPRIAELFWLREAEDVGTEELCHVLSISATNVWTMLYRARTRLRECLTVNWFGKTGER
jgi:RNA polymerase sigma-70 factor (ECF subfamily)